MVKKTPTSISADDYHGGYVLGVYYADGTFKEYDTEGPLTALVVVNCPGVLNYIRSEVYGYFPEAVMRYIYTYTENGVTTAEFGWVE